MVLAREAQAKPGFSQTRQRSRRLYQRGLSKVKEKRGETLSEKWFIIEIVRKKANNPQKNKKWEDEGKRVEFGFWTAHKK